MNEHQANSDGNPMPQEPVARDPAVGLRQGEVAGQPTWQWEQALDALPDLIAILDPQQRIVCLNRAMADRLGLPREQCIGRFCYDVVHGPDGPPENCPHRQFVADGLSHAAEMTETRLNGDFLVTVSPLAGEAGADGMCMHVARDVSCIKRVQRSLGDSQQALQALLNATTEVAFLIDCQGTVLALNQTLATRLGRTTAEMIGNCIYDFMPADLAASRKSLARQAEQSGMPVPFEELLGGRQVEGMVWPVRDAEGRVASLAVFSRDVTRQRHAEEALRASEAKFRSYIEHAPTAIFVADREGRYLEVNTTACSMFGYTEQEFLQLSLTDVLAPVDVAVGTQRFEKVRVEGQSIGQIRLRRKDQSMFWASVLAVRLAPDRFLGFVADTSELRAADELRHQLQLQLAHMGRVATVGEMIAGIAHEVNQPLYSIVNYAKACTNLLSRPGPRLDELRECTKEIASAAVRAGEIIARLRTFLSRSETERGAVNLRELVEETVMLVAYQTRHRNVSLRTAVHDPLVEIDVDRVQVQQVLVNLLQNGWEALEEIHTRERVLEITTAPAGRFVEVCVVDNGPGLHGVPPGRLFDPFVTTKPKGLGVGLSISRTIVLAHGGQIWASENPRGGCLFHITLPCVEEKPRHVR
jgi:two-component system sensor kinase FixL